MAVRARSAPRNSPRSGNSSRIRRTSGSTAASPEFALRTTASIHRIPSSDRSIPVSFSDTASSPLESPMLVITDGNQDASSQLPKPGDRRNLCVQVAKLRHQRPPPHGRSASRTSRSTASNPAARAAVSPVPTYSRTTRPLNRRDRKEYSPSPLLDSQPIYVTVSSPPRSKRAVAANISKTDKSSRSGLRAKLRKWS